MDKFVSYGEPESVTEKPLSRREFFLLGGGAALSRCVASAIPREVPFASRKARLATTALEERVAAVVQAYDAQGNHRTATAVDRASAHWLVRHVQRLGVAPSLEPFHLSRVDPKLCYLRVANRRIDGVPLFDAGFTVGEGVRGSLGPLGSDAEIGLAESVPSKLEDPANMSFWQARHSRHKAVALLTGGNRPGLFLINATSFSKPFGPPALQISSVESQWLMQHAGARVEATLVAQVTRTAAEAFNIIAKIAGSAPTLAPLVVMTPRSGWWQCASERGGGLACWLEAMRAVIAAKPLRDCLFVATSGHELGALGLGVFLQRHPDLVRSAHAWIHAGANIGAARQQNLIQASSDALEQVITAAIQIEGLTNNNKTKRGSMPIGDVDAIHRGGGNYISLLCQSETFHSIGDRWPEAMDVAELARYARVFANVTLHLATKAEEKAHD
jgi:hypothetical protein